MNFLITIGNEVSKSSNLLHSALRPYDSAEMHTHLFESTVCCVLDSSDSARCNPHPAGKELIQDRARSEISLFQQVGLLLQLLPSVENWSFARQSRARRHVSIRASFMTARKFGCCLHDIKSWLPPLSRRGILEYKSKINGSEIIKDNLPSIQSVTSLE
jgi:hypothetical protein